jgi:arginase
MRDRFILTPFFLDTVVPGLKPLAGPSWIINEPLLPEGSPQARIGAIQAALAGVVAQTMSAGRRPVSIAGDCLSAIGVLAGLQRSGLDPVLIWCDAHGDFNTGETTPSGFLGGMPLAMIAGRGEKTITRAAGLEPLAEDRIILTDARDLDPGERASLRNSAVTHLQDPKDLLSRPLPEMPLYIHIDTDIITAGEAPAQNYPVPGGPSAADLRSIFLELAKKHRVAAVSVSCWNPDLDKDKSSEKTSMSVLQALLGAD